MKEMAMAVMQKPGITINRYLISLILFSSRQG
jgi:hypothetical protein